MEIARVYGDESERNSSHWCRSQQDADAVCLDTLRDDYVVRDPSICGLLQIIRNQPGRTLLSPGSSR